MSGYAPIAIELSRYNQWQNEKLYGLVALLPPDERSRDRGMFFGDILATLDHMLMVETRIFGYINGVMPPPFDPKTRMEEEFDNLRAARTGFDARLRLACEGAPPPAQFLVVAAFQSRHPSPLAGDVGTDPYGRGLRLDRPAL